MQDHPIVCPECHRALRSPVARPVLVRMRQPLIQQLDRIAEQRGTTRSDVIRTFVEDGLGHRAEADDLDFLR